MFHVLQTNSIHMTFDLLSNYLKKPAGKYKLFIILFWSDIIRILKIKRRGTRIVSYGKNQQQLESPRT